MDLTSINYVYFESGMTVKFTDTLLIFCKSPFRYSISKTSTCLIFVKVNYQRSSISQIHNLHLNDYDMNSKNCTKIFNYLPLVLKRSMEWIFSKKKYWIWRDILCSAQKVLCNNPHDYSILYNYSRPQSIRGLIWNVLGVCTY